MEKISKTQQLDSPRTVYNLDGLGTKSNNTEIMLPLDITPGTYYIYGVADTKNSVKELNKDNNGRSSNTTIVIN